MNDKHLATWLRVLALVGAVLTLATLTAARASADTQTFGSDLTNVPTLDTANGDYSSIGSTAGSGPTVISPNPHVASDTSIWNVTGPGSGASPAGGQVLDISLEGCAREDTSAPEQTSQGVPVNSVSFQTLTQSGTDFTVGVDAVNDGTGNPFTLPFCSNSSNTSVGAVNTSTVTTFQPIHMCVAAGAFVDFHDIGGFVPRPAGSNAGPWYPQGVPFLVLARTSGSTIDSFVGGDAPPGAVYSPSDTSAQAGWGSTTGDQLEMQVVLGTGGDAYGLCPGGTANEPSSTSNQIVCDFGTPSNGHPACDRNGNPVSGTATGTSTGTGTTTGAPKTGAGGVKTAAPKISQLMLSEAKIKAKDGLTLSFSDTVTATTTVGISKEVFGRKSGSKCVTKVERKLSHNPVCRFFKTVQSIRHVDTIGRNSVHVTTTKLARGTYQVSLVSRFGTHKSRALVTTFKVK